jgi:hypothetical protein
VAEADEDTGLEEELDTGWLESEELETTSDELLTIGEAELVLALLDVSEGDGLIVDELVSEALEVIAELDDDELATLLIAIEDVGAAEGVVLEVRRVELEILAEDDDGELQFPNPG